MVFESVLMGAIGGVIVCLVVDMWRSQGITCLQCAEGDF